MKTIFFFVPFLPSTFPPTPTIYTNTHCWQEGITWLTSFLESVQKATANKSSWEFSSEVPSKELSSDWGDYTVVIAVLSFLAEKLVSCISCGNNFSRVLYIKLRTQQRLIQKILRGGDFEFSHAKIANLLLTSNIVTYFHNSLKLDSITQT